MLNLAPWYYRNLLGKNNILECPEFFEINLLNGQRNYEAVVSLKENLRPKWVPSSKIYRNSDGSGTSKYKNIAVYKSISEALERLAFYELVDQQKAEYCFDLNPTTTGMAAYPSIFSSQARIHAKQEAVERWAIHQFNLNHLPLKKYASEIVNLTHYEIIVPFNDVKVSLLSFMCNDFYVYGFAGGQNLKQSFDKALIELDRNIRVLKKAYSLDHKESDYKLATDKTILFFASEEGYLLFKDKVMQAPRKIFNKEPKVLCDVELKGEWSKYTRVWRYLLEDSYFNCASDRKFFMF